MVLRCFRLASSRLRLSSTARTEKADGRDRTRGHAREGLERGIVHRRGARSTRTGTILFSDIGMRILKFDPKSGRTTVFREPSGRANGMAFDLQGRLVVAEGANTGGGQRVSITEGANGTVRTLADNYDSKRFNSPNDVLPSIATDALHLSDPRHYVGNEQARAQLQRGVFLIGPRGDVIPAAHDGHQTQWTRPLARREDALCFRQWSGPPGS